MIYEEEDNIQEEAVVSEESDTQEEAVVSEESDVQEETVVLDFNHPLAGKDINFDVELVSVE